MSFMKILQKLSLVAVLMVATFTSVAFAQEDITVETTSVTEIDLGEGVEASSDDIIVEVEETIEITSEDLEEEEVGLDFVLDEEASFDDDLTLEEVVLIIADAPESSEDEVTIGDVVVVTDEFVIIESKTNEYVKVPITTKRKAQRRQTGAFINLSDATTSYALTIIPETSTYVSVNNVSYADGVLSDSSGSQSYQLNASTKVIKNGQEISQSDLESIDENQEVSIIIDDEGQIIAVTIIDPDSTSVDDTSSTASDTTKKRSPLGVIIGALALVIIAVLVSRRRSK